MATAASSRPAPGGAANRGQFAAALYEALGLGTPSSTNRFGDAGYLAGIASTLGDLGITNGVAEGQFGTFDTLTRGQAFTMIARALGLADANTDIATASQALVNAGVVQGYPDGSLGLEDPVTGDQVGLLMDRIGSVLDTPGAGGETRREELQTTVDSVRDRNLSRTDPTYAAYLQQLGVGVGEIEDEMALRQDLYAEDQRRLSETYQRASDQAMKGIGTDFENRGMTRSGFRMQRQADRREQIAYDQSEASTALQRAYEETQRRLGSQRSGLEADRLRARTEAEQRAASQQIQDQHSQ